MTRKRLFTILLALLFGLGAAAQDEAKKLTVSGTLTRVMAIGGESTGWAVQFDTQTTVEGKLSSSIEVKFKDPKLAEKYNNKRVKVTGMMTHRQGVETGSTPILEVGSIKNAKAPSPTT